MKNILRAAASLLLAAFLVLLAVFLAIAAIGMRLDRESKAFVDRAAPAIAAHWDVEELHKIASPEFDADTDYNELADYLASLHGLGPLTSYDGSSGDATLSLSFSSGCAITADYDAEAEFATGRAIIHLTLIRHQGTWQLLDFSVDPESYAESDDIV